MRGAFWLASPAGRIASTTSSTGASRTASQSGKRLTSRLKARSRLESVVLWLRIVLTSSSSGSRCERHSGYPYNSSNSSAMCAYWRRRRSSVSTSSTIDSGKGDVIDAASHDKLIIQTIQAQTLIHGRAGAQREGRRRDAQAHRLIQRHFIQQAEDDRRRQRVADPGRVHHLGA